MVVPDYPEDVYMAARLALRSGDGLSYQTGGGVSVPFMVKAFIPGFPIGEFLETASCELG
jgi:hypothetical protein